MSEGQIFPDSLLSMGAILGRHLEDWYICLRIPLFHQYTAYDCIIDRDVTGNKILKVILKVEHKFGILLPSYNCRWFTYPCQTI